MKKSILPIVLILLVLSASGQQYSSVGGLETLFKGKHRFTAVLDERKKTLSFQTDAEVSVITLETYTAEERIARKGQEYTDKFYTKNGTTYTFDLTRPELRDKYAYWLKVSTGRNGVPLAEYYFQKRTATQNNPEESSEEQKNAAGETIIRTNATCTEGKTKLLAALKALDGVQKVTIDPRGTVNISYSSDGTPYKDLLSTINENGFNANNQKTNNPAANPCTKPSEKKTVFAPNLLDASPGYKKAAIKFVPIKADYSKGYSDTKVYEWKDPLGNQHTATGKEILDEVNDLEQQLNERGHSLREKKALNGLTLQLNAVAKNDFANCVITNKLLPAKKNPQYDFNKPVKLKNVNIAEKLINSTVYSYLGYVTNSAEFKSANMNSSDKFTRIANNASADMQLVMQAAMFQKVKTCRVDVAETPKGSALFATTIVLNKFTHTISSAVPNINFGDAVEPQYMPSNYSIYSYKLLFENVGNKLPAATRNAKPYYLILTFYDAAGQQVQTYQPNDLVLNNQLPMPLNVTKMGGKQYSGYDYQFLDPGLHCFGFYAKSSGYNAQYFSQDSAYDGKRMKSTVNANMEIGVKYYNWERLINSNAPLTKDFPLFGYDISSEEKYLKLDGKPPPIGFAEYKKEDPDKGIVTLLGETHNLANTNEDKFVKVINENFPTIDFFIGPVPCNITIGLSGNISVAVDYQSKKIKSSDAKLSITPHADITLHGSGGIDAKIMYAKVYADVKLLEIDMPYTMEVSATNTLANIQPLLSVGGLSGEVYFKAGFCIPIPLVDDICESFRIDILNWKGYEKKFTVDPKKGISL